MIQYTVITTLPDWILALVDDCIVIVANIMRREIVLSSIRAVPAGAENEQEPTK